MSNDTPAAPHAREIVKRLEQEAMTDGALDARKATEILQEWESEIRDKPDMVKIPFLGDVS